MNSSDRHKSDKQATKTQTRRGSVQKHEHNENVQISELLTAN